MKIYFNLEIYKYRVSQPQVWLVSGKYYPVNKALFKKGQLIQFLKLFGSFKIKILKIKTEIGKR